MNTATDTTATTAAPIPPIAFASGGDTLAQLVDAISQDYRMGESVLENAPWGKLVKLGAYSADIRAVLLAALAARSALRLLVNAVDVPGARDAGSAPSLAVALRIADETMAAVPALTQTGRRARAHLERFEAAKSDPAVSELLECAALSEALEAACGHCMHDIKHSSVLPSTVSPHAECWIANDRRVMALRRDLDLKYGEGFTAGLFKV